MNSLLCGDLPCLPTDRHHPSIMENSKARPLPAIHDGGPSWGGGDRALYVLASVPIAIATILIMGGFRYGVRERPEIPTLEPLLTSLGLQPEIQIFQL